MNFHVHIPTDRPQPPPKGWKNTGIVLEGSKTRVDHMFTKHYQLGKKGFTSVIKILSDAHQVELDGIIRIKLERDSDFTQGVTELNYAEIHMLCPSVVFPASKRDWVKSRNPRRSSGNGAEYFYNLRVYSAASMSNLIRRITESEIDTTYLDLKFEQVIYDTNWSHDSWWARAVKI